MKIGNIFLCLVLIVGAVIAADSASTNSDWSVDTSRVLISSPNRLTVGNWFSLNGTGSGHTLSLSQYSRFNTETLNITTSREPIVKKNDDNTWTITFKQNETGTR